LPSDERCRLTGEIGRVAVEASRRRELAAEIRRRQLEETPWRAEVLERVAAEVEHRIAVERSLAQEVTRGAREEHLPGVTGAADGRGAADAGAGIAVVGCDRLRGVDPDPRLARGCPLQRHGGSRRGSSGRKRRE
jgi:hypothetical protein